MSNIFKLGDELITPDDFVIINDVKLFLKSCNYVVYLDRKMLSIPDDVTLDIVSSVVLTYRFPNISIGNHSRFVVALGGIDNIDHGVPLALHGFVQIWYTSNGDLFSHDYLEQYPH